MARDDNTPQSEMPANQLEGHAAHEPNELSFGGLRLFSVGLVVVLVVVYFVIGFFMRSFENTAAKSQAERPPLYGADRFPEPSSQVAPRIDLAKLRAQEKSILESYGWVDPQAKVARIPIDRAMTILLEQGLPKGRSTPPRGSRTRDQK